MVELLHATVFKGQREQAVGFFRTGEEEDAGGVHVQPVNRPEAPVFHGQFAGNDRCIGVIPVGSREDAGGLVYRQQMVIGMENLNFGVHKPGLYPNDGVPGIIGTHFDRVDPDFTLAAMRCFLVCS